MKPCGARGGQPVRLIEVASEGGIGRSCRAQGIFRRHTFGGVSDGLNVGRQVSIDEIGTEPSEDDNPNHCLPRLGEGGRMDITGTRNTRGNEKRGEAGWRTPLSQTTTPFLLQGQRKQIPPRNHPSQRVPHQRHALDTQVIQELPK